MRLNWKHSTNKSPVSGGSTLKSQKRSEIFFCGTQSPAPCMLFCKQSTYNSPVWSKTTSRRLWRITSVVDFALFPRASTLFLFWLWHTRWGISRVGRRWIIHPLARRVEQRPDSCRRSSTIKDKYGYVSHVYSANSSPHVRCRRRAGETLHVNHGRHDSRGGLTGLLGVLDKKNIHSRNPIWVIKSWKMEVIVIVKTKKM